MKIKAPFIVSVSRFNHGPERWFRWSLQCFCLRKYRGGEKLLDGSYSWNKFALDPQNLVQP
jgi:hypothetical protein